MSVHDMQQGTNTIRIVAAVIRDASGRVLLVRKRGSLVFQQPGGKRDAADVDDLATLARELREELGCTLVNGSAQFLWQASAAAANEPEHVVEADIYRVEIEGELRLGAEIVELCWVDPTAPGDLPIAGLSRQHILPYLSDWQIARRLPA
jgi:8-oxo-dGTP diphosphatase